MIFKIILAFAIGLLMCIAYAIGLYAVYRGGKLGANEDDMGMVFAVCYAAYLGIYTGVKNALSNILNESPISRIACVVLSIVPYAYVTVYAAVAILFCFMFHFKKNMKALTNLAMVGVGRFAKSAIRHADDEPSDN